MSTVNAPNSKIDQTVKIFDTFYLFEAVVPAMEYDVINSYFRSVMGTTQAAANFTVTVFRIAQESHTPVMTIFDQIKGLDQPQLSLTLAYYLNGLQSLSTLLGIDAVATPNYYAARNVVV
jgi:pyruvate/2-oxoacid:ferredoxin oxidoreductase alpha subunit